jgi:hypothetical protein
MQVNGSSAPVKRRKLSWVRPLLISAALVLPCFWQPIVSCVDLQSHLYNAWLAELIRGGSIHGLWIGHQSTNVIVDLMLSWLMKLVGVSGAERIVTSTLVLIFFWGAFQFISAVRGKTTYWLAPWLAILSYGFVFQLGILNYYLSCGMVLWLFSFVWRQRFGWRALWVAPLLVPAFLAHPLPVLWFVGLAIYCWLAQLAGKRAQALLFLGSVGALALIRLYVQSRHVIVWTPHQLVYWTGADQALLYGWPYVPVALALFLFSVVVLCKPENGWGALVSIPAQAYFLTAAGIMIIPSAIQAPNNGAWAAYIATRLSLLSGVLLLAVLARSDYRRWYVPVGTVAAAVFFFALYHDIGSEARVEAKMAELVQALPAGEHVVAYSDLFDGMETGNPTIKQSKLKHLVTALSFNRLNPTQHVTHLISRACLGHCFDYMNYEPATGQFRIHALPGNHVAVDNVVDADYMEEGTYVVKPTDPPLYALFRCGPGAGGISLRQLPVGEPVQTLACSGMAATR